MQNEESEFTNAFYKNKQIQHFAVETLKIQYFYLGLLFSASGLQLFKSIM